jgi:UDP-2,4-diacetamido-2,4,6-trideoxy-beta-L-altropyranose hydrolase
MEFASNRLLILTEAGAGIGFGHYSRCAALNEYMIESGVDSKMFLRISGSDYSPYKNAEIFEWLSNIDELNQDYRYTHVLVDSYQAPISVFGSLKKKFKKVIAIDDFHRVDEGPDLVINPNIFGDSIPYKGKAVGGREFVILRKPFRVNTDKSIIRRNVGRILVTLGGSDVKRLLPRIIDVLSALAPACAFDVVAANETYKKELQLAFVNKVKHLSIFGFVPEAEMKNLMASCDLAVSACGQTLHELAKTGVPTIGICVGDDQILNMRAYIDSGFLFEELYGDDTLFFDRLVRAYQRVSPQAERTKRSIIGIRLFKGNGLNNIYNEVFA